MRVKVVLVTEDDGVQRENRLTCTVHRPDLVFETRRGNDRPKVTVGIYYYPYPFRNCHPIDPGDKGIRVSSSSADANCVRLGRNTSISNIDIIIAGGEISTGVSAQCDIERASGIARECVVTGGRVAAAVCVARERKNTGGRVEGPCIVKERLKTGGRVAVALFVVSERTSTVGRIAVALCVASECTNTGGSVVEPGCIEVERTPARGRVVVAARVASERICTTRRVAVGGRVEHESIKTDCRVFSAAGVV